LHVIRQLQARYPRNRLLALEAGSTALRAGRPAEALQAIDDGRRLSAHDSRPRAFGEEARWHYYRGAALHALERLPDAQAELRAAVAGDARQWVHGRARLELGRIAIEQRQSDAARRELRAARADCRADHDTDCADQAKKLLDSLGADE
jgi:tetratricopeptide (TPR) repeat protein